ncbi:nitroreductase family protein [Breznakiella homolactica]|uniref:Putative nitroreductase TM1586 domain-containing protein n=1 Tax=Breznakiella homolactica TaxID=2798577 RepID=A0A7T8B9S5_9SPIR|nr:nitroreductase family protein [Breznakiella homolactica]QQO08792.1 hypothetical protein JFL75_17965 [Breznakiella homolactica]
MDLQEAMRTRHSVRAYTDRKIEGETLEELRRTVEECNRDSGLHIQLCTDEPEAFSGMMARYGKFRNVRNYIALVGKKDETFEERCGYYGEKLVLKAAQLGLNTCWVALTFSKGKTAAAVGPGEKLLMVITIGYGENAGVPHKTKSPEELSSANGDAPEWFRRGVEAAQLAPTAMNQQKFRFTLRGDIVAASPGSGFYTKTDLGIAKYHFEAGAGSEGWRWA